MKRGHVPVRTCVGCLRRLPKDGLVRFVSRDGSLVLGHAEGRGLYLCRNRECFEKALRRKGLRGLSGKVPGGPDLGPLREAVTEAAHAARGASGGGVIG